MSTEKSFTKSSNSDILLPVLQILDIMKKNIQNKSFLRSLKAIARKIKNLIKKAVLDKTIFDNLAKLRNKKLPNSYEKVIDNIIYPILNIFKYIGPNMPSKHLTTNIFLTKQYVITATTQNLSYA